MKSVEQRIEIDGDHSSMILILNPQEVYAEWPEAMGRLEIDQTGVRTYRTDGTLFNTLPASAEDASIYQTVKELSAEKDVIISTAFPMPDVAALNNLSNEGWTVQNLSGDAVQLTKSNTRLLLEPANKRSTTFTYEGTNTVEKRVEEFRINEHGILVPSYVRTETREIRPSGVCMERVRLQKYRTYTVAATKKGDGKDNRSSLVVGQTTRLQILPNPATDRLVINYGSEVSQLTILDAFGKTIWEKTGLVGDETAELSIATWPSGFYFVRIETSSGRQTTRFIKSTR